ncbi:MAG: hypothetical protein HY821_07845 [Acidobacteria bacterium]|nr:hypothetical protein [Acidobacteriota bacterium]
MKLALYSAALLLSAAASPSAWAQSPAAVRRAAYECWANGQARMLLNFTIKSAADYLDSDNKPGKYRYDAATGRITFQGGGLDGAMPAGFIAVYHEPKGHPTVSFRSPRGAEAAFCESVGR